MAKVSDPLIRRDGFGDEASRHHRQYRTRSVAIHQSRSAGSSNRRLKLESGPVGTRRQAAAHLLHVAALKYHYGEAIAVNRHTHVWFQGLGGKAMTGPSQITKFFEDFFHNLLCPQTVSFIKVNLERCLREKERHPDAQLTLEGEADLLANQRSLRLERWACSPYPFSLR